MRPLRRWLAALIMLALGCIAAVISFVSHLPPMPTPPFTATDAVIVLTGGGDRIKEGLTLLRADLARALLITGVHEDVGVNDLLRVSLDPGEELDASTLERIHLGYSAANTRGNAIETAAWMERQSYASLRLVTASYHMPRSLLEFRKEMPDVSIIAHPVQPVSANADAWWLDPSGFVILVQELAKYAIAWLRRTSDTAT